MVQMLILLAIGLAAGVLSGLFGIGGGILIIPALVYVLGFSQHRAQGTSLAALLLPVGILGVIEYYRHGNVDLRAAGIIALSFFGGALLGSVLVQPVPDILLRRIFGGLLLALSLYMILGR